jgi:hypothetical protein
MIVQTIEALNMRRLAEKLRGHARHPRVPPLANWRLSFVHATGSRFGWMMVRKRPRNSPRFVSHRGRCAVAKIFSLHRWTCRQGAVRASGRCACEPGAVAFWARNVRLGSKADAMRGQWLLPLSANSRHGEAHCHVRIIAGACQGNSI